MYELHTSQLMEKFIFDAKVKQVENRNLRVDLMRKIKLYQECH